MLWRSGSEVLLSPDGFCSLTTPVPQVLVIHDLAFLHYPHFLPRMQQWYYRHYTPVFIRKARRIITVSECSRVDILKHYPDAKGRVEVVANAADAAFRPLEWAEKEAVKERFTGGREYFVCVGSVHPRKNLVNLLKGFSAFKKRQQSNMKLVIAGRMAWQTDSFMEALRTFKFRDDVVLTGYLPRTDLAGLMGAAYALVYPSLWEGFGLPVLEAMQCGVPVLASGNSAIPEVAGTSALYFDPTDPAAIGERMMLIFKEEGRRRDMTGAGLERAAGFQWDRSAAHVREILADAAKG
jgi:glycosyltransferase involved in cell wall biosynthesis